MIDKDLSPARVEAFSDGVIAIIITIMVLELHVPTNFTFHGLTAIWPTLGAYALSYVLVAIYWVNHHHLFSIVKRVNVLILWTNVGLLFFLSLLPFFTSYVGQSRLAGFPVLCYSVTLLLSALSFLLLEKAVARTHFAGDDRMQALQRGVERKNMFALLLYVLAIIGSFWIPALSMALILIVAILYFVPGAWVGGD